LRFVEAWQNRPLAAIHPIIYPDGFHLKLRRQGRIENVAVYLVLSVDLEGDRDILGHWLGDNSSNSS
jgi:transposase-like protein